MNGVAVRAPDAAAVLQAVVALKVVAPELDPEDIIVVVLQREFIVGLVQCRSE